MRSATVAFAWVLATGCHSSRSATPTVGNDGGDPPAARADESLAGPYARILDAPELSDTGSAESPAEVTVLGSAAGAIGVALREVRGSSTAATCVVTLETPDGFFVGHGFLCSADRSDETVVTDQVTVTIERGAATIRFRTSYQIDRGPPDVHSYELRCNLTGALSCTTPPAIGGYE